MSQMEIAKMFLMSTVNMENEDLEAIIFLIGNLIQIMGKKEFLYMIERWIELSEVSRRNLN